MRGILLTNVGTPSAPTPLAVKQYLREFLSDKRIVSLPKVIWLPLLHGFILLRRARYAAALYQKIWTDQGSPLLTTMQKIREALSQNMQMPVALGMHYGEPSIAAGLAELALQGVKTYIICPLFPQYSHATIASTYDRVQHALRGQSPAPAILPISAYANNEQYIHALAESVREQWQKQGDTRHLLISFHGLPKHSGKRGDPYASECEKTARALAQRLALPKAAWTLCYQSRFGFARWLSPLTTQVLSELPKRGIKQINVICPGFAVDCLETLEEIAIRGRELFLKSGGESLAYIPALNDNAQQIALLQAIIHERINHLF